MKRKPQKRAATPVAQRPISTTPTRITLMILIGLATGAACVMLLRFLMAVAYTELMRTNTGAHDWAVAPFLAIVFTLVLFPWSGVKRLPRIPAIAVGLIVAVAAAIAVYATQPAVAVPHMTVLLASCALAVAIVLRAMWATITFRVPTQEQVFNGIANTAIEIVVAAVFSAAGAAIGSVGGGSSGSDLSAGGGRFGGGGSSGSW